MNRAVPFRSERGPSAGVRNRGENVRPDIASACRGHRFGVALAVVLAAAGVGAHAAGIGEIYAQAAQNDPVLAGARAARDARQQGAVQARAGLLPRLGANASTSKTTVMVDGLDLNPQSSGFGQPFPDRDVSRRNWGVGLNQPVVNLPSWFNYRAAAAVARQADWEYDASMRMLITRVAEAYLNVLRGQAALESAVAAEEAVQRQLEQVQQRFDVGLVAITDVLDAKATYDNSVVGRIQAEGNHGIFFEGLRTLTGSPYDEIDRLAANLPIVAPMPADEEEWVTTALATSPGIKSASEGLAAAEHDLKGRLAGHLPTISAAANYGGGSGSQAFGGFVIPDQSTASLSYSLSVELPLFNGLATYSGVKQARAGLEQARQLLLQRELTVARDTRNLYRLVATEVVRVRARGEAIKSAESALEATETGYEVGTRNIVDVLQAQQRLFASQLDYATSRYDYVLNLLRLKETAGVLDERDVAELDRYMDADDPITRFELQ